MTPDEDDEDQAMMIQILAPGLDWGLGHQELEDLGDEIQEALGDAGEVESNEMGPDDAIIHCIGRDAEEMFKRARPTIEGHPLAQRATVILQSGPDSERTIQMGQ